MNQKVDIILSIEEEKLNALTFALKKEKTTVQVRMEKALQELYEHAVPDAVREYLDSKYPSVVRPKRSAKSRPTQTSQENHVG